MIRSPLCGIFLTHHADLRGDQVAQSVEPADVGLQVTGFTLPEETLTGKKTKITLRCKLTEVTGSGRLELTATRYAVFSVVCFFQ